MQNRMNEGHGNGHDDYDNDETLEPPVNGRARESDPKEELSFRLKLAIDQGGKFKFRLNDMAAGFAAGRNTTNAHARRTIEDGFAERFGLSPHEYLKQGFEARNRERENGQSRSPGRREGIDRDR